MIWTCGIIIILLVLRWYLLWRRLRETKKKLLDISENARRNKVLFKETRTAKNYPLREKDKRIQELKKDNKSLRDKNIFLKKKIEQLMQENKRLTKNVR